MWPLLGGTGGSRKQKRADLNAVSFGAPKALYKSRRFKPGEAYQTRITRSLTLREDWISGERREFAASVRRDRRLASQALRPRGALVACSTANSLAHGVLTVDRVLARIAARAEVSRGEPQGLKACPAAELRLVT